MKKAVFILFVFYLNSALSQSFNIENFDLSKLLGFFKNKNDEYALLYKDENKAIKLIRLDKDLRVVSNLKLDLKINLFRDKIDYCFSNGNSIVIEIEENGGNANVGTVSNNTNVPIVNIKYVVVSNENNISERLDMQTAGISGNRNNIKPDPSGEGYYLWDTKAICKINNQLTLEWKYELPVGGYMNQFMNSDTISITSFFAKNENPFSTKLVESDLISVNYKTGKANFICNLGLNGVNFSERVSKVGNDFLFFNMVYSNLGNPKYKIEGAELRIVNDKGKMLKNLSLSGSDMFSNAFYTNKKYTGYLKDFIGGEAHYYVIGETPKKLKKFFVFRLDSNFNVLNLIYIDKEDENCFPFYALERKNTGMLELIYRKRIKLAGIESDEIKAIDINFDNNKTEKSRYLFTYSEKCYFFDIEKRTAVTGYFDHGTKTFSLKKYTF